MLNGWVELLGLPKLDRKTINLIFEYFIISIAKPEATEINNIF